MFDVAASIADSRTRYAATMAAIEERARVDAHNRKRRERRVAINRFFCSYTVPFITTLPALAGIVAVIIAIVQSPSLWPSMELNAVEARTGTAFAILLPAAITVAISLHNRDEWKNRLASAISAPILCFFMAVQVVDNPYSDYDDNPGRALVFGLIAASGAFLGAFIGELLPQTFLRGAFDRYHY